jgi:hypothetical protein
MLFLAALLTGRLSCKPTMIKFGIILLIIQVRIGEQ